MKDASILTVSSRALLDAYAALGHDVDSLLESIDLSKATVYDPDARIPGETVVALWREACRRSRDPNLPLHAAEALPFGAYRVIDFLARSCDTVGEGLTSISRYFPLINSSVCLVVSEADDGVAFRVSNPREPGGVPRLYAEYTLAAVFLRARSGFGIEFPLTRVEFSGPSPADPSEHERIFDCPVVFESEHDQLVIPKSVWNQRVPSADQALAAVLQDHADMLMKDVPKHDDLLGDVSRAVERELRGPEVTLDRVAACLSMSSRTLQRRLHELGTNYAAVLDQTRARVARACLEKRQIAIAEVAYLLGFADPSSFNRSFKRWTGLTPGEYRRTSSAY